MSRPRLSRLSNKFIFMILAITLVLATAGTIVNVGKMYGLNQLGLTGAATSSDTGTSTITIAQSTSITNNHATLQFGSGFVNSSCTVCNMDSNGSANYECCGTFNRTNNLGFLLENTGNINLSINYTCSGSCTAAAFIGGTSPAFQIKATNNSNAGQSGEVSTADTLGVCDGDGGAAGGNPTGGSCSGGNCGLNFTIYKSVTAGGDWLCGNSTNFPLSFTDVKDAFVVDLNVSIPADASTGSEKTATFTFNALATG